VDSSQCLASSKTLQHHTPKTMALMIDYKTPLLTAPYYLQFYKPERTF